MSSLRVFRPSGRSGAILCAAALLAWPTPAGADLITREQLENGMTLTRAQCAALPEAVWVRAFGEDFCIRYYASTAGGEGRKPVVYLAGDKSPKKMEKPLDTKHLTNFASRLSKSAKTTGIYLARPGFDGSSGHHKYRWSVLELHAMNAALDAIKQRHGFDGFHLVGQSGGAMVIGGLLGLRRDIGCAVPGAGLLVRTGKPRPNAGPKDRLVNSADGIDWIVRNSKARILVVTDPEDKTVPPRSQTTFVQATAQGRRQGRAVFHRSDRRQAPRRHPLQHARRGGVHSRRVPDGDFSRPRGTTRQDAGHQAQAGGSREEGGRTRLRGAGRRPPVTCRGGRRTQPSGGEAARAPTAKAPGRSDETLRHRRRFRPGHREELEGAHPGRDRPAGPDRALREPDPVRRRRCAEPAARSSSISSRRSMPSITARAFIRSPRSLACIRGATQTQISAELAKVMAERLTDKAKSEAEGLAEAPSALPGPPDKSAPARRQTRSCKARKRLFDPRAYSPLSPPASSCERRRGRKPSSHLLGCALTSPPSAWPHDRRSCRRFTQQCRPSPSPSPPSTRCSSRSGRSPFAGTRSPISSASWAAGCMRVLSSAPKACGAARRR